MYRHFAYQPSHMNRQGWDAYAGDYANLLSPGTVYHLTKEVIHRQIAGLLAAKPRLHVLDFNCGVGNDFPYFLARGWKITACDGSVGMLNKAWETYRAEIASGQISLYLGQMETLDAHSFPDAKFDLIFSVTGGFSYVPDDSMRAVNQVLGRYLTDDGIMVTAHLNKFCLSDTAYHLAHARVRPAFLRWQRNLSIRIKGQDFRMFLRGPGKVKQLTPDNLRTIKVLPLLWLTPPYQTGFKPPQALLRLLKWIELKTCQISLFSGIADQVVAVARRSGS